MTTKTAEPAPLPHTFAALARVMVPHAIRDHADHENVVEMVDRLMTLEHPTPEQEHYAMTLVQLVEAYEAEHHALD